jgi:predicted transport protein
MRAVFEGLDARIQAVDPNVSQEVLKLYIGSKTETNCVDIIHGVDFHQLVGEALLGHFKVIKDRGAA